MPMNWPPNQPASVPRVLSPYHRQRRIAHVYHQVLNHLTETVDLVAPTDEIRREMHRRIIAALEVSSHRPDIQQVTAVVAALRVLLDGVAFNDWPEPAKSAATTEQVSG